MTEQTDSFGPTWAIVDVMGHQRYAGLVSERTIAGQGMLQIDVPEVEQRSSWIDRADQRRIIPAFTKLITPSAIHSITPCSEQIARQAASRSATSPITSVDVSRQLSAAPQEDDTTQLTSGYDARGEDDRYDH